ncbi:pentatricopeptide repeat-containing protein At2g36980, mitochondrial-like [Chenopodium quinoa]|nr:pentatricopeptide repeat-containing protein At2g36980, mitochondrial-like [Chenopodium quinoa]
MSSNLFKTTSIILATVKAGQIVSARKMFDEMPIRDTVAWNAMLTSYSHLGIYPEVFSLFRKMRIANTKPDHFTFTATLSACSGAGDVKYGSAIHGIVVISGCQNSLPVRNALIDMYGKCMIPYSSEKVFEEMQLPNVVSWCSLLYSYTNAGLLGVAAEVFIRMPERVEISWNIMIAGHARHGDCESCLNLFRQMREDGGCPDQWTLSALVNSCVGREETNFGLMIHAFVTKSGWYTSVEVQNSILTFYTESESRDDVSKALKSMDCWNQVSWNSVIDAHMKMGNTHEAWILFQQMPEKNVVSWTSMVAGYARNGQESEAIWLFVHMLRASVNPDELAFGAFFLACSGLALLGHGLMIHGCLIRHGFRASVYVGNGLVNMYAKCGDLLGASRAFGDVVSKDLVSWNTMLFAYGLHGRANQALQLYEEMLAQGNRPDVVTFIGLLMTCSHAGLVEDAQCFLDSMSSVYGLSHEMHHVACILDLLGRGGYLTEARSLAKGVKVLKGKSSETMLGACSMTLDILLAKEIGDDLIITKPLDEMSYVLMSNLYCASGQWKKSETVRKIMADQGVKKTPGCSWIELKNESISFVSGDFSHPYMDKMCKILSNLELELRYPCILNCNS